MILPLYRALTAMAGPGLDLLLHRRLARGKEDPERMGERMGIAGLKRPEGALVWLHGASVGEAVSLLVLIERLRAARPDLTLLVTTGTVTSARLMAERLPDGVIHQFVPLDHPKWVGRFLDHWRPDLVLWAESEFWPNLLTAIKGRGVPMILVQGRVSDRSLARWRWAKGTIAELLSGFVLCLAQTPEDGRRLGELGAARVHDVGNLKFAAPPLPVDEGALSDLTERVGGRPLWLAASTHAGEEALAGRVHKALAADLPGLLTVIAPRHPDRGRAIAAELAGLGLAVARRSEGRAPEPETDVYLADTMGEMGLFYRLCPLTFVGKSLLASGGQNPIEPARLGSALIFGPRMDNFREAVRRLHDAGAGRAVADEAGLACAVADLLKDFEARARMAQAALGVASAEGDAPGRVMAALAPMLERIGEGRR